ncbi:MAG TPA: methylmalonyl Co-A mutase-associated GTPase MeaB [Candidatus Cloacimonetes bacterium]|nr:methylmalonyl Co-A mutase-associated GTPase MeaB [Candidatus Cloacimonadota bacterium]
MDLNNKIEQLKAGNVRAAAQLITQIENQNQVQEVISAIYPFKKESYIIGITGAPGVGKSTITDKLIEQLRNDNKKVGVVAIDPTSPFSGGAILGDRIRLQKHATDKEVFIRSMGSRGHLGGLAPATNNVITILSVLGCDYIIIETVGVGQSEVEIVKYADTVLLVLTPGSGDSVQVMKAGIMEIGDIFVINKCDRQGSEKIESELKMFQQISDNQAVERPVVKIIAPKKIGIPELYQTILDHQKLQQENNALNIRRRARIKNEIISNLQQSILSHIKENVVSDQEIEDLIDDVFDNKSDPLTISLSLIERSQNNSETE